MAKIPHKKRDTWGETIIQLIRESAAFLHFTGEVQGG